MAQQNNNAGLIRLGLLALPLGGLLTLVELLGTFGSPDPDVDPTGGSQFAASTAFSVYEFVGVILGPMLSIFGIVALLAYLANTRGRRWAVGGMVASIVGLALALSLFGVVTYALPALAQAYLDGQQDALALADAIFNGPTGSLFLVVSLLYTVGSILFAVAIWRSGVLPRWAGVLYAVGTLLLTVPLLPDPFSIVGAVLLIVAGGWIFLSAVRQPSERMLGEPAQPRVQ